MNHPGNRRTDSSFEAVYAAYYDRVFKYAYTLLLNREDAEDVTADTFLTVYEKFGRYDPSRASMATWITRIAHNRAVNLMRSASYTRQRELCETGPADGCDDLIVS